MWIVAGGAEKLAVAFQKAGGSPQTVSRVHDLEFVVMACAGSMVEVQDECVHRFAGLVGEWTALIALDCIRQREAGGFEMTHHAHLHLPLRAEPGRVDDCVAHIQGRSAGCFGKLHVFEAGPVAALAIDTLR